MVDNLVTLAEARAHLRLDYEEDSGEGFGPDDAWLDAFIPAVSEAVASWVKEESRLYVPAVDSSGDAVIDSSGEAVPAEPLTVRRVVKAAVLLELSSLYRFREGEGKDNAMPAADGYVLNKASTSLLAALRRPTVR